MKEEKERSPLRIGELAARAGCSVATVRYYEDIGLLPPATRRESGQRVYDAAALRRIAFIRRCRDFGFTLEQTKALAALADGHGSCASADQIFREHLAAVRARAIEIIALERRLSRYAEGSAMLDDLSSEQGLTRLAA